MPSTSLYPKLIVRLSLASAKHPKYLMPGSESLVGEGVRGAEVSGEGVTGVGVSGRDEDGAGVEEVGVPGAGVDGVGTEGMGDGVGVESQSSLASYSLPYVPPVYAYCI